MKADLDELLAAVRTAEASRSSIAGLFCEIVRGRRDAPEWLVAYCMHALRWPEVLEVAREEQRRGDPATLSQASEVVDAYERDWVGIELFDLERGQ